jgi:tetratricopeptide (TPR) repeat protein
MGLLRSFLETIALFLLCVLAFLVAFFILPFLYQGASDGLLMTIWNLFMANAAFFGLSYWHLTDLKADGFLPNANSYALILILAAFGVAAVPMGFLVDSEWWETLYTIAQAGGEAIALKSDYAEAHTNLGVTLQDLGRLDEARASHVQALDLKPDLAEARSNLGNTLHKLGKLEAAEASYKQAIALRPDNADAHYNLGNMLKEMGRLDEAEATYKNVTALKPKYAEAHYNLGNTLHELRKLNDAEASYRAAIALKFENAKAHNNLGVILQKLGKLEEAEESYKRAIALKFDYAESHNNLGNTLQKLGRIEEAEASFTQAITLRLDYAEAHRNLAFVKRFSSRDQQFFQMQTLYRSRGISETERCHICFALAKAAEDIDEYATAFQFYAEGNALRKKNLGYNKALDKKLFRQLKASYRGFASNGIESEKPTHETTPVFIVGMPRSGTTLVEQIISSHPLVTGAGELPFVSQYGHSLAVEQSPVTTHALTTFSQQYRNALQNRSGGNPIVTNKMPQNFRYLGLIAAALPDALIIHVKRNPAAVCWANFTSYFVNDSLGYCYNIDDILHYHGLYEDLIKNWHKVLPGRIYDLNYERLTEHQEEETRKLIDYLGLEWDAACLSPQHNLRAVSTASSVQVRQRVYRGSSEKWKRYRPYLDGALDHFSANNK